MKVSELISALATLPEDVRVVGVCPTGREKVVAFDLAVVSQGTREISEGEEPETLAVLSLDSMSLQNELAELRGQLQQLQEHPGSLPVLPPEAELPDSAKQYGELLGRCITAEYQLEEAKSKLSAIRAIAGIEENPSA